MNTRSKRILAIVNNLPSRDELPIRSNQKKDLTLTQTSCNNYSKPSSIQQQLNDEFTADWPQPKKMEYANSFDLVHQYDFTQLMQPLVSSVELQHELQQTATTQQHLDQSQLTELTIVQPSVIEATPLLLSDDLFPSSPEANIPSQVSRLSPDLNNLFPPFPEESIPPQGSGLSSDLDILPPSQEDCIPSLAPRTPPQQHSQLLFSDSDDSVKDQDYVLSCLSSISSVNSIENVVTPTDEPQPGPSCVPLPKSNKRKRESGKHKFENKKKENMEKYGIKPGCNNLCKKLCTIYFTEDKRQKIHSDYWSMDWEARAIFVKGLIDVKSCEIRSTTKKSPKKKRMITYKYFFMNDGEKMEVCKTFFLCTLGYDRKNDTRILTILKKDLSDQKDKRDGRNLKIPVYDKNLLTEHINSFNPCVHHYRRSHAPKRKYLPSDLTITAMYENFSELHPDNKCCFETYRKHVTNTMNISFARLGHEECEVCESFQLHNDEHVKEGQDPDCKDCTDYLKHHEKYTKARKMYDTDAEICPSQKHVYVSVDLQKVIMLPRIDAFKIALFCPRIVAYNETFVPLGKYTSTNTVYAVIWHEAISGRKQEDIISTFRAFLLSKRDAETITIWLDNCSAQNKNWCLLSYLIQAINSIDIAAEKIVLKYFEPGHTFMSADSFHHNVEQSLQKMRKVYDFGDFTRAVELATPGKVQVKSMDISDFYDFKSHISLQKLNDNRGNRVYLKDIVEVMVQRGQYCLFYKKDFESQEYDKITCLKSKKIPSAPMKTVPKGVNLIRKQNLIKKLGQLMPKNRLLFWKNLPVTAGSGEEEDFVFEDSEDV